MDIIEDILISWQNREGNVNTTEDLLNWINKLNNETFVKISETNINNDTFWFYDDYNGEILNRKRSFFSIKGIKRFINDNYINEQPIIIQPEIGYLGIICKKINGVLNLLMQAKIEPGNVNCVQISPTIQATKSNFTRAHGGKTPLYFEYFENSNKYNIIYDQVQSEQAGRFYKKRNRNIIINIDFDIELFPNYKWMTIGQLKELMAINNLVNMDTRTVLSGLPIIDINKKNSGYIKYFKDKTLYNSIFETDPLIDLPKVYQLINNFKMFNDVSTEIIPINELIDWKISEKGIVCKKTADFSVNFYDINIEGREVQHWTQPLFKAIGQAIFGLITKCENETKKVLVKIKDEIGSFDKIELSPSVQLESTYDINKCDNVELFFIDCLNKNKNIVKNVILSEEGGRFYHEQNKNVIIEIENEQLINLPENYLWINFSTLIFMVQFNNCLNIQLRNLLSLIDL